MFARDQIIGALVSRPAVMTVDLLGQEAPDR